MVGFTPSLSLPDAGHEAAEVMGEVILAEFLEDTLLPASTKACYESPVHGGPSALVIPYMIPNTVGLIL